MAVVFVFLIVGLANAQLVINEGSNKNYPTVVDEDGDYEDWIEIYNSGNTVIDLFNYSLSDNSMPGEWKFPHQMIHPGEYILVLCSGKNRFATSAFTAVCHDTLYTPRTGWSVHYFTTPFYWDGFSNLIVNICTYNDYYTSNSIHQQSATSYNSSIIGAIDGGSACGLTGGGLVRQRPNIRFDAVAAGTGNLQNGPTDYPAPYGNWYWSARQQFLFRASELTAAGLGQGFIDSLAFEVLSTSPVTYSRIDLSLASTGLAELSAAFIPAEGNKNHTNFGISSGGETIKLYNPSNILISSLNVNCGQGIGVSTGAFPDASSIVRKFAHPTPGTTNNLSVPAVSYAGTPVFSVRGGVCSAPISVSITAPNTPGTDIYYTMDGSDPDTSSLLWSGTPIFIFQNTVLRARAFADGFIPGLTASASYLFNAGHVTPVISVMTDSDNLFGPSGMFDNPSLDLLKPASVEYFDSTASHNLIHSGRAGIMMDGGWAARSQPQRAFRINFDHGVLGDGPVFHRVIPDRPSRNQYGDFYLRNGSNNFLRLPYKDAAQVKMMGDGSYNYYAAWRPVSVYINGSYWGLYELREKTNIEMFNLAENASPGTVEILSSTSQYGFTLRAIEGSVASFHDAHDHFMQLDPADTSFWSRADRYFDLKYYNDYIIAQLWMDNVDWGFNYNNLKLYRSDATDYRWRYILTDLEYGLLPNDQPWIFNCYHNYLNQLINWPSSDPDNPHLNIWLRGIQNDRFRNYFINRFADLMNTLYLPSRLLAIDNSMFNQTVVEMANEYRRWGDPGDIPGQLNTFYQTHLLFQDELNCRPGQMRNHIQSEFGLPQQVDVSLDVHPSNSGHIVISTISPEVYPWSGVYFDGLPVSIEARALPGYQFSHWEGNGLITDTLSSVFLDTLEKSSVNFKAHFISSLAANNPAAATFSVFPNPSSDQIRIRFSCSVSKLEVLSIVDLPGRKYNLQFSHRGDNEYILDVSSLPGGYYIINFLADDGRSYNTSFVKVQYRGW